MIKIMLVTASFVVPVESGNFYNETGDFLGQYQQQGPVTDYYNSTGDYLGQTRQQGNQVDIYNSTGDYKGQVIINPKHRPLLPTHRR